MQVNFRLELIRVINLGFINLVGLLKIKIMTCTLIFPFKCLNVITRVLKFSYVTLSNRVELKRNDIIKIRLNANITSQSDIIFRTNVQNL